MLPSEPAVAMEGPKKKLLKHPVCRQIHVIGCHVLHHIRRGLEFANMEYSVTNLERSLKRLVVAQSWISFSFFILLFFWEAGVGVFGGGGGCWCCQCCICCHFHTFNLGVCWQKWHPPRTSPPWFIQLCRNRTGALFVLKVQHELRYILHEGASQTFDQANKCIALLR